MNKPVLAWEREARFNEELLFTIAADIPVAFTEHF